MAQGPLEATLDHLFETTQAGRVTLRWGDAFALVHEICAPGVRSMQGAVQTDAAGSATYAYLRGEQQLLIQADCATAAIAPPRSTQEQFGVRAQMLAPIVVDGVTRGVISVHETSGPREWTAVDTAALEAAAEQVRQVMCSDHVGASSATNAVETGRDLVGYGRSGLRVRWPGDARIAVSLVVNYEEGSEYSYAMGDGRNEIPNEFDYPAPPIRDLGNESVFEYGSRAGIWRLQRLFDELDLRVTFFGCAVAFELNPEVGAYIHQMQHEVCCHGWRWENVSLLDRDTERDHLLRAVASIEQTCGARPRGWYSRCPPSLSTRELLVEEGGFLYDCDSFGDDLPYFVAVAGAKHLVIPYSFVTNDSKFLPGQGFSDPSAFVDYCTRAFDYLYREGEQAPKMMTIGLHPRFMGQPSRASALREVLEHMLSHEGVWFPRRIDVAEWWIEHASEFGAQ